MHARPAAEPRIDPLRLGYRHGTVREHLARYRFAAERLRGTVLDAGCGTGYGTHLLACAPRIHSVLGVDRDRQAIRTAHRTYAGAGIAFSCLDLLSGAARTLGPYDGIACLEVLEHLSAPERLLATLDLALRADGRLIVSTPLGRGREVASDQPGHHFQLRRVEFLRMLQVRFRVRLFGQKGEGIEPWRPGGRYFLMVAVCAPGRAAPGRTRCAPSA